MLRKGETVMTFVLIIGLLVIGVIVIANLKVISAGQSKAIEEDVVLSFLEQVTNSIENTYIYPNDIVKVITFEGIEEYTLSVRHNVITMYFPEYGLNLSRTFYVSNINVIENDFITSGNISVITKKRNLLVTNNLTCVVGNGVCDPACIMDDICDSDCYGPDTRDACVSFCVDKNKDGLIDEEDMDDICDLDCYDTFRNGGIYDFDCLESNDGICDPDTHNNPDTYCDSDCKGQNGICDPDCRVYDPDCHHSDNTICEPERNEKCDIEPRDCNCTPKGMACDVPNTGSDMWGCI